jgi:hypothetical protein
LMTSSDQSLAASTISDRVKGRAGDAASRLQLGTSRPLKELAGEGDHWRRPQRFLLNQPLSPPWRTHSKGANPERPADEALRAAVAQQDNEPNRARPRREQDPVPDRDRDRTRGRALPARQVADADIRACREFCLSSRRTLLR